MVIRFLQKSLLAGDDYFPFGWGVQHIYGVTTAVFMESIWLGTQCRQDPLKTGEKIQPDSIRKYSVSAELFFASISVIFQIENQLINKRTFMANYIK